MIERSYKPVWLDYNIGLSILETIKNDPAWWMNQGIQFKYLDVRFDSRSGHMLIKNGKNYGANDVYLVSANTA